MPAHPRKPYQHQFNEVGESQMSECFQLATWSVTKITVDYGQDFLLHPFHDGEPTLQDCYIQLKSTDDVHKYQHRQGFRYPVSVVHLDQWRRLPLPIFVLLWDITLRCGYYVAIQPLIVERLAQEPSWLDGGGKRSILIPVTQCIQQGNLGRLPADLEGAYHHLHRQDQVLAVNQQISLTQRDGQISADPPTYPFLSHHLALPLSPSAKQLQALATLQAAAVQRPRDWRIDLVAAQIYYARDAFLEALQAINQAKSKGASGQTYDVLRASILTEYANTVPDSSRYLLVEAEALFAQLGEHLPYPAKTTNDYNQGNVFKALGRFTEALVCYDRALSHDPKDELAGQILTNKGGCLFHLGRHDEEYAAYAAALQRDPQRWQALSCWAATEVRRGQPSHARELLLRAFAVAPAVQEQPAQTYALAYACYQLEQYEEASHWAQQTLKYAPTHRRALHLQVQVYSHRWRHDLGCADAALTIYRQWLANEPADIFVVKERYLVYRALGADDSARAVLDATTLTHDASAASLYYYGTMLAEEGQVAGAIALLEQARALSGERYMLHQLGHLYVRQQAYHQAIACYARLLPDGEITHLSAIADGYHALHHDAVCIPILLRLLTLHPTHEHWWNNLQAALLACGAISALIPVQCLLAAYDSETSCSAADVATVADMLAEEGVGDFRKLRQRPWNGDDVDLVALAKVRGIASFE